MTNREALKALFEKLEEIEAYERCIGKMQFDIECCAPEAGMEQAGEDMAVLGKHVYTLTHDEAYVSLVERLFADSEGLTPVQAKAVEHLYEAYLKRKNISPTLSFEMDKAVNKAYGDWLKAKAQKDFSVFLPAFEKLIAFTRESVSLREEKKATVYDTLLDDFEKGGSIAQLDAFFAALKERIVPLVQKIREQGKSVRSDFLSRPVATDRQEAMSRYLLALEGLHPESTVLMTTEHPFTEHYGQKDVRVTTHFYEDNFISNIFSTLHEGGHALFMQNEPEELYRNHCADRMSCAMHECISRFYENIIGRSEAFIAFLMPRLSEFSGDTFADVSERELYEAVNIATPGLIRMEADELTYCLHIMIRYELEKAFINGEISAKEVPALWNEKYKAYLGLEVPDDAVGCLQDVHWSSEFGYFPSYALGNAYGAQILHTMRQAFDVDGAIREGNFKRIGDWLSEHVFSIASLKTPEEWIRAITGESLNVNYYLDYLEEKFTAIYF